jgi:hypothetical protein
MGSRAIVLLGALAIGGCGQSAAPADAAFDLVPVDGGMPDLRGCGLLLGGNAPACPCTLNGGEPCADVGKYCSYFEAWFCDCRATDAGAPAWHCEDRQPRDMAIPPHD